MKIILRLLLEHLPHQKIEVHSDDIVDYETNC